MNLQSTGRIEPACTSGLIDSGPDGLGAEEWSREPQVDSLGAARNLGRRLATQHQDWKPTTGQQDCSPLTALHRQRCMAAECL